MTPHRSAQDPGRGPGTVGEQGEVTEATRLSPEEAFAILGNETRLAILQALAESRTGTLGFAALRKRVGVRDGSRFNYHLRKLEPWFVEEVEAGYAIRPAGFHLLRTIAAGTFTEHPRFGPIDLDAPCVVCGGALQGRYEQELVLIDCADCEQLHVIGMFPPAGLAGRTERETLLAFDRSLRGTYRFVLDDVCPTCGAGFDRALLRENDTIPETTKCFQSADALDFTHGPASFFECEVCGFWALLTAGEHLLFEPVVVEFHRDHGVDLDDVPLWELDWTIPAVAAERTPVVSDEPFRVEVVLRLDDELLRVLLDDEFAVVETDRSPAG